jgi:N-acetylmuramoyl-L-alanine amidase
MKVDEVQGTAHITARFNAVSAEAFAAGVGAPKTPGWDLPEAALKGAQSDDGVLTVVIDPGHGGVDPGAVRGGLTEKTLMLSLALHLREALIREGDTRVILTRDDDSFVSLDRRVSAAHEVGADLFISLHADVLPTGRAQGATVYTLSDEASDEASAKLAERHDRDDLLSGVDLTGKDDVVANVLLDLARQETTPRTTSFSQSLTKAIGAAGVPLNSHPLRAADFSVLKAADIPSVLIEVGYLSSDRDRNNLKDPEFLTRMAEAMREAILEWAKQDAALRPLVRQ